MLAALSALGQTAKLTELTADEKLMVIDWNREETDAWTKAQRAQSDYQVVVSNHKVGLDRLKEAHAAQGCELNRGVMRWENCHSVVEKKK